MLNSVIPFPFPPVTMDKEAVGEWVGEGVLLPPLLLDLYRVGKSAGVKLKGAAAVTTGVVEE